MQIVIDIDKEAYDRMKESVNKSSSDYIILNGKPLDSMLDKIRAEIKELDGRYVIGDYAIFGENSPRHVPLWEVLHIIDKYKAESE